MNPIPDPRSCCGFTLRRIGEIFWIGCASATQNGRHRTTRKGTLSSHRFSFSFYFSFTLPSPRPSRCGFTLRRIGEIFWIGCAFATQNGSWHRTTGKGTLSSHRFSLSFYFSLTLPSPRSRCGFTLRRIGEIFWIGCASATQNGRHRATGKGTLSSHRFSLSFYFSFTLPSPRPSRCGFTLRRIGEIFWIGCAFATQNGSWHRTTGKGTLSPHRCASSFYLSLIFLNPRSRCGFTFSGKKTNGNACNAGYCRVAERNLVTHINTLLMLRHNISLDPPFEWGYSWLLYRKHDGDTRKMIDENNLKPT